MSRRVRQRLVAFTALVSIAVALFAPMFVGRGWAGVLPEIARLDTGAADIDLGDGDASETDDESDSSDDSDASSKDFEPAAFSVVPSSVGASLSRRCGISLAVNQRGPAHEFRRSTERPPRAA